MGTGHPLDGSTIGLWRFDENNADTRGDTEADAGPNGGTLTVGTNEGVPGIADYDPIPGTFARKFISSAAGASGGLSFSRNTSAGTQAAFIATWTFEAFIRIDALPGAGLFDPIFGHAGTVASDTAANNSLGLIQVTETGKVRVFWESGAGVDQSVVSAVGTLVVGTWHHLAISKDATAKEFKVYVDGVLTDTLSYATEADSGTTGVLVMGRDGITPTRHGSFTVHDVHFSNIVRDGATILADAARKATTGLHVVDANTSWLWRLSLTPPCALDSGPYQMHLKSEASTSTNITAPTGAGGIINDGGRGRTTFNAAMGGHYVDEIRDALLADFTFEGWFILSKQSTALESWGLFRWGNPGVESQSDNYFGISVDVNGTVNVDVEHGAGSSASSTCSSTAGAVPIGSPVHIAVRKTMEPVGVPLPWTCDIFVNGVNVTTGTKTGRTNYDGGDHSETCYVAICAGQQSSVQFTGVVDDVRISNVARTDDEILANFKAGWPWIDGGDAPEVVMITPTVGTPISRREPATFRITDDLKICLVVGWLTYAGDIRPTLVYDGDDFTEGFRLYSTAIADDDDDPTQIDFSVIPDGGWEREPTQLRFRAVDNGGLLDVEA